MTQSRLCLKKSIATATAEMRRLHLWELLYQDCVKSLTMRASALATAGELPAYCINEVISERLGASENTIALALHQLHTV